MHRLKLQRSVAKDTQWKLFVDMSKDFVVIFYNNNNNNNNDDDDDDNDDKIINHQQVEHLSG